jgi:hypothetical protein
MNALTDLTHWAFQIPSILWALPAVAATPLVWTRWQARIRRLRRHRWRYRGYAAQ